MGRKEPLHLENLAVSHLKAEEPLFRRARARPKSVGFGEVARGGVAWKSARSALWWIEGSATRADGIKEGASGRSIRDSAPEAWPSEVRSFLGPESSLPQVWGSSRGASASTEAVSAQRVREGLPTDPSPGPILEPRVPRGGAAVAAETGQPTVSANGQGTGETPGAEPALPVSLRRASAGGPSPGCRLRGSGNGMWVRDSVVRGSAPSGRFRIFSLRPSRVLRAFRSHEAEPVPAVL